MRERKQPRRVMAMLQRRAWIGLSCTIAVAVIALAISLAQSTSYSGTATLLVPPAFGATTPGNPDGARMLAETYAQIIPGDDQVRAQLAERLHVEQGALGTISVGLRARLGILDVGYRAPRRAEALRGARGLLGILSHSLPPGSPVESKLLLLSSMPATAQRAPQGGYTASGVLLVSPGAGSTSPGNAEGASRLAQTYVGVLSKSTAIEQAAAARLGVSRADVADAVSVTNEENTSLLTVSYRASSPSFAARGANTVASVVTSAHPVAESVAPGSLRVLQLARPAAPRSPAAGAKAVLIGLILGAILGLILMLTREYGDRRVDDSADLAPEARCPATMLDSLEDGDLAVLKSRWSALGPGGRPTRVALIPAGDGGGKAVERASLRLAGSARGNGHGHDGNGNGWGAIRQGGERLELLHSPDGDPGWEALALSSDLTVVVAATGARAQAVREQVEHLEQLGSGPAWALLTASGRGRGRRS